MGDQEKMRAGTVTALDDAVGDIIEALKTDDMFDNTVILFSSDNGGAGDKYNKPLRGRKEYMYEGGVRVVGVLSSPMIQNKGSVYNGMIHVSDWFSSFLSLAGRYLTISISNNFLLFLGLSDEVPEDSNSLDVLPSINNNSKSPRTQIIHNIDEDQSRKTWQVGPQNIF